MILTQCAACAKPLAHDAPRCVRCWTRYCDASCQLEHWSNGHKKQCKKIARGGGAEQFYADAKAKEAADAAVSACAPQIPADAICYICRDDASREGLVTGCGCHGGDGIAHVSCLVRMAQMAVREIEETGCGHGFQEWQTCFVCDHNYHSEAELALAWACWKSYLGQPETFFHRCQAMRRLGAALQRVDAEAALPILEAQLASLLRSWPSNDVDILSSQSSISICLESLGRYDEALRLHRVVYDGFSGLLGPTHEKTILEGNNLNPALRESGRFDEAKQFAREHLSVARQALGEKHHLTVDAAERLAESLVHHPGVASRDELLEAASLFADVVKQRRCSLGTLHPRTICTSENWEITRRRLLAYDAEAEAPQERLYTASPPPPQKPSGGFLELALVAAFAAAAALLVVAVAKRR